MLEHKLRLSFCLLTFLLLGCCHILYSQNGNSSLVQLRDSLDAITLPIPQYNSYTADVVLQISNQSEWDNLTHLIEGLLKAGKNNIRVEVSARSLMMKPEADSLYGLKYPKANIIIEGNGVKMIPFGPLVSKKDKNREKGKTHYSIPYNNFCLDDILLDKKDKPLSLYEDFIYVDSDIEAVNSYGTEDVLNKDGSLYKTIYKTWRFKIDLPDLNEEDCKDFYILLTRDWTSYRHNVVKVENGYLYFNLKSDDATTLVKMCLDPNSDMKDYKTHPRVRLVNSPFSKGIYYKNGRFYIPNKTKQVRIGKGGRLFKAEKCQFNTLEISGFQVKGAGNVTCVEIHNCIFKDQLWVKNNTFENTSGRTIQVSVCRNASVYNNKVYGTRMNAVYCTGWDVSVWNNELSNIGYMSQTMALTISGQNIHVFKNIIEDFNYSGISTGSDPEFIIERNIIRFTPAFLQKHQNITLADGGGIYVSPWCKSGIIRYNVIENLSGNGANRGVFLDDGGKNLFIYGNLIMNTANCYDIDLRLCKTYANQLPDHNTNNAVFHNVMTGGYRFEEKDAFSSCRGGENILLETGAWTTTKTSVTGYHQDMRLKDAVYKKGKLVLPKKYASQLSIIKVDGFIRDYLSLQ